MVVLGSIFYKHTFVGNDTYSTYTKMGGRTSLFLASQRMPSRYGASADTYNWRTYRHIKYLYMVFGVILYRHNVVGGGVNCTNDIYGGRTRSACRYGCEHRHIQF